MLVKSTELPNLLLLFVIDTDDEIKVATSGASFERDYLMHASIIIRSISVTLRARTVYKVEGSSVTRTGRVSIHAEFAIEMEVKRRLTEK